MTGGVEMRDIKFRGRRLDNGEWTYGYLFMIWERAYILWGTTNGVPNMIEVDPETVGQCTELPNKNGKEIYEGDIIRCEDGASQKVYFNDGCFLARDIGDDEEDWLIEDTDEVIGTIYDKEGLK
jgi:uncharacterized phage protein (TIGR01671 family)